MSEHAEVLLFLPSWCSSTERQFSDILATISARVAGVVVVLVSLSEEDAPMTYEHHRIMRRITSKEAAIELLISHQVTQLPFSMICSEVANRTDGKVGTRNGSNQKSYLNDGTYSYSCHQIHDVPLLNSESCSATDLFASAVEAYDAFNYETAASKFYAAILEDPLYKSALFNFAGLLHMVGYPTLAVFFIEKVLLLDKEDMIAHSFLWALTQLKETSNIGIESYRRLSACGDLKASQKLAALTGLGDLAAKGDPRYAQRIYDDMGDQFEDKLVTRLGYRGPWDLFELLCEVIDEETDEGGEGVGEEEGEGEVGRGREFDDVDGRDNRTFCGNDNENKILNYDTHASTDAAQISIKSTQHSTTHNTTQKRNNTSDDKRKKCHGKTRKSKYPKKGFWRILDLGCGSGLCGKVFQELVNSSQLRNCQGGEGGGGEGNSSVGVTVTGGVGVVEELGCVGGVKGVDLGSGSGNDDTVSQLEMLRAVRVRNGVRNGEGMGEGVGEGVGGIMVGADISIRMVEISRRNQNYTCVVRADLSDAIKIFERTGDVRSGDVRTDANANGTTRTKHYEERSEECSEEHSEEHSLLLDLVIVADTFIYVGALGSIFAQIKRSLKKNGLFIFSIEDLDVSPMRVKAEVEKEVEVLENKNAESTTPGTAKENRNCVGDSTKETPEVKIIFPLEKRILDDGKEVTIVESEIQGAVPGWGAQLLKSARFAHSNSYIEALSQIHGFGILKMKIVVLRTEETVPLYGRLYVLQTVN